MAVDTLEIQLQNNNDGGTKRRRKRMEHLHDNDGQAAARDKLSKRILLSLTKPSFVLGLCPKPLRSEHRKRLRYLLHRLVKQHNWVRASGVLSVYLKGTVNDASPFRNRFKFWVLLELLKHVEDLPINSTRIQNLYDIWSKKIGSMNCWSKKIGSMKCLPVESRYAVQLEDILFSFTQGKAGNAYGLVQFLEQENFDIDPVSKIVMGLTYYELWYSSIPRKFQWRDSDQVDLQENTHMEVTSVSNEVGQSKWLNSAQSHMAESEHQCESDASVRKDVQISRDVGRNEDTGASMEVDANHTEMGDPFSNNGGLTQDTLYALEGLDLCLLPLRFSKENSLEDFKYKHIDQYNDRSKNAGKYYKNAVKYLQLALDSTPFASAALLPLTQLLLIGGQIVEALIMLEQQCYNSSSVFPIRLRAVLLEHIDPNNSILLHRCFEDVLQKDPRCSDSLAKLVKMHQNGDYSVESLLEMIALHLDSTYAEYNTWKMFSSCFYKLSFSEQDCMSTCSIQNKNRQGQNHSVCKTPKIFTEGESGKSWRLRCRWWLTRYFNNSKLKSDVEAGDLQLLTYKAACASYMYGQEFSYVGKAYSHLQKENHKDLLLFLDEHKTNSFGFYQIFQKKATCMGS